MDRRGFLVGLAGAGIALVHPPRTVQAAEPLRLGYQVNIWGSLSAVALKSGVFERLGLTVEGIQAPVGRQTRDAMVAGRIDLGTFAVPTFLLEAEKGELVAVALAGHAGKTVHVLVRPDSVYRTLADLRGKRVATGIGSSTDAVFAARVAPRFGLTPGSYEPVNTLEPDKVGALAARQVEASVSTEPFISVAEEQGLARSLVSFETYDPIPVVLAAGPAVADKRRDATVAPLPHSDVLDGALPQAAVSRIDVRHLTHLPGRPDHRADPAPRDGEDRAPGGAAAPTGSPAGGVPRLPARSDRPPDGAPVGEDGMAGVLASRTLSVSIGRPPGSVNRFVSNPEHLPKWAGRARRKPGMTAASDPIVAGRTIAA
jgi:hypothetical protein